MTATWIGVSSPPSGISKTYAKQNQQTAAKQPWFPVKNVVIVACSTQYFTVVRAGFAVQLLPAFSEEPQVRNASKCLLIATSSSALRGIQK